MRGVIVVGQNHFFHAAPRPSRNRNIQSIGQGIRDRDPGAGRRESARARIYGNFLKFTQIYSVVAQQKIDLGQDLLGKFFSLLLQTRDPFLIFPQFKDQNTWLCGIDD